MRATLHDELMRDAGFATNRDRELARLRATRQRLARSVGSLAVALGGFSGLLLEFGHGSSAAGVALAVLAGIGLVCGAVLDRVERWKGGE